MAGRIKDEDIALVRERARIDDVVGSYVTLKNAGGGNLAVELLAAFGLRRGERTVGGDVRHPHQGGCVRDPSAVDAHRRLVRTA